VVKYFSPEKPLFGKLSGIYWWKAHVRGNEEYASIDKEYDVRI